jgi:hypothetical protein
LRKISNDYAEALNRGTLEKLAEWKEKFYAEQAEEIIEQPIVAQSPSKSGAWGFITRLFS